MKINCLALLSALVACSALGSSLAPTWHAGGIFCHLAPAKQVIKKPG